MDKWTQEERASGGFRGEKSIIRTAGEMLIAEPFLLVPTGNEVFGSILDSDKPDESLSNGLSEIISGALHDRADLRLVLNVPNVPRPRRAGDELGMDPCFEAKVCVHALLDS
jgi:hypothetical protein